MANARKNTQPSAGDSKTVKFKVVTATPAPRASGRESRYPWDALEIGQAFFIPGKTTSSISTMVSTRKNKHPGENYTVRQLDDGEAFGDEFKGVSGVGVYRIAKEAEAA